MRALFSFALLASGLLAMPAAAQPVVAAPQENLALGRKLAQLTNSEEMLAGQVSRMIQDALPPLFAADPEMQALEKDYPGITKKLLDAASPMLRDETLKGLPRLWDRLGALYAARLTAAELGEVIAFFSGGIKARMMAASVGVLDTSGLLKETIDSPDGKISKDRVITTVSQGATGVLAKLSPADRDALARFGASPAGRRFNALMPEAVAIATAWANEPSPETDAKLARLMSDVLENAAKMESSK